MRAQTVAVLGLLTVMLLAGCTQAPEPMPTVPPTPSETETPTVAEEPEPAFDVTCDEVAAAVSTLVGEPSTPVEAVLSVVSSPSWYPGPAQHMLRRSGGVACSAGDPARYWEVILVPEAERVLAGAAERNGYFGDGVMCDVGFCVARILLDGVYLEGEVTDPALGLGDEDRTTAALRPLVEAAARSLRTTTIAESVVAGAPCELLLSPEELAERVGAEAELTTVFDGWGIPAEIYHVVNGSEICYYSDGQGLEGTWYLTVTTLPGGAWAFEGIEGEEVDVEGADAARASVDVHGSDVLDVRVGPDWIRLTAPAGDDRLDVAATAAHLVRNLGVGRPAPR